MSRVATADVHYILRRTFGFSGFRGQQEAVVTRVLAGLPTLALMPTGAGKSLCYQLPALALDGTAIVISPLIALMHDQIRAADALGIRAASMTSADADNAATAAALKAGELDLLYVAPERATTPGFEALLAQAKLSLFAIDEAHCVSEWGHDFRPDYRMLRPLLDRFADVPRLALTATADEVTRADVLRQLGIPDDGLVVAGFDRPNIRYAIGPRANAGQQVADFVRRTSGAGIVYANSRAATERLAEQIARTGRPTGFYHAGLPPERRSAVQAEFVASEDMVMVATIAFGMGIDKPDVRFVVHAGLPKSIEAYYQETGRAGRDGDPAEAALFWSPNDFARARQRLSEVEEHRLPGERARLDALAGLVETPGCRRAILLRHFGEDPPASCGNCDNCENPPRLVDATELARKLLSAVYRTGQSFGMGHIEKVLLGRADERVTSREHDRLSVFGIVGEEEAPLLRPLVRSLTAHGMLTTTDHGGLALGPAARPVLKGERPVTIAEPPAKKRSRARTQAANPVGDPLFDALRAKRKALASERGVPAYVIFHDSVLRDMARERPETLRELGELQGVGATKLETYGADFIAVIRDSFRA
ncbi:DNA helicase RecQ [Erythrobacter sp. HL-111]|uniref:DNA helicase RecQ n=1 Tax=Erythrobacter sp. HL-111 TaxID=1798193 RepID=UPI0006DB11CB|nr:DNA helicase RecQ [Erythrobacter sp. HL-111]KPP94366.1 MAG: ATP-dependent DNA helicase RecQ [Erythrobacteraceae bacterium HL-111]SDS52964.1 ATP-dependent DNA helicase RecQ [Erythrobacter sp. HL-111]